MLNINMIVLVGLPIFFVAVWCSVLWLISQLSGWNKMAKVYPCTEKFIGPTFTFQSARINWASFNNSLTIGVSPAGLYLVPMLFFRFFFSPLLIPWSEIDAEPKKKFLVAYQRLSLKSLPAHKIEIQQKTFERIIKALKEQSDAEPL